MNEEQIQWLKDNLKLELTEIETHNTYGGSYGGEFKTRKTINLLVDGVIVDYVEFVS